MRARDCAQTYMFLCVVGVRLERAKAKVRRRHVCTPGLRPRAGTLRRPSINSTMHSSRKSKVHITPNRVVVRRAAPAQG